MKIYNPTGFSSSLTGSFSGSVKGTLTATGNIIPDVSGAYDIGSTAFPFKDLYITQNSLKFIDDNTGAEIGRISVNSNTGDIKLLNTKNLTEEQKATLTAENVGAEALSPVSASALWVSQSISPGHTNTSIGHTNQKFHTVHTQYVSASSTAISGDLTVGGKVTAQEFHTEFVSASIVYESGSTQFGNSADDTHTFTGSAFIEPGLTVTGDGTNHIIKAVRAGNTRLFVGNAVNAVGINTETVNNPLTVNGGADFSGNVGIGTTSPATGRNLHIANSTTGILRVEGTSTNGEAVVELYGKNSSGTQRALIFKYDNADLFRIGTAQAVPIRFETSDTERLRIEGGGNVGIGITTPSAPLHVYKTADYSTIVSRADWNVGPTKLGLGAQYGVLGYISTGLVETTNDTSYIALNYKSGLSTYAEGLRVWNNGNVGIGTTSPQADLQVGSNGYVRVYGANSASPGILALGYDTDFSQIYVTNFGGNLVLNADASNTKGSSSIQFRVDDTERMQINSSGNVGIGTVSLPTTLTVGHGSHGIGAAYLGANSLPSIAGLFTDSNVNGGTGFGDLHIKSRSDYGVYSMFFHTAASNNAPQIRMAIKPDGNVGIGNTSPGTKLDVSGNFRISDRFLINGNTLFGYKLAYNQFSSPVGTTSDADTADGTAIYYPSVSPASTTMFYGPYTSLPNGDYIARFRMKVTSNSSTSALGQIDVVGTNISGNAVALTPSMFRESGYYQYIDIPFRANASNSNAEFRGVGFSAGVTDVYLDHVLIVPSSDQMNIFQPANQNFNIFRSSFSSPRFTLEHVNGNIGIGSSTPIDKLDVQGGIIGDNLRLYTRANITSSAPYTSTIPYGWSAYSLSMPCDNVDRTVFSNINDSKVFMWIHFGDSASRDLAHYSWMATSVPYGLASFSQLHYMDGGWNTGGFVVSRSSSGNNYNILIRVSSYYSSSNTAYGNIYLLRIG